MGLGWFGLMVMDSPLVSRHITSSVNLATVELTDPKGLKLCPHWTSFFTETMGNIPMGKSSRCPHLDFRLG